MTFTPTHRITYTADDEPQQVWLVHLNEDGTAVCESGDVLWRMSQGSWIFLGSPPLKKWPEANAETRVERLDKPPKKIPKGQAPKHMPVGSIITLRLGPDRQWHGQCECDGTVVERQAAGLMGIASKLCQAWLKESGRAR